MTWYSYLYMFIVWGIIIGLNIYCFYKVLTSKNLIVPSLDEEDEEENSNSSSPEASGK